MPWEDMVNSLMRMRTPTLQERPYRAPEPEIPWWAAHTQNPAPMVNGVLAMPGAQAAPPLPESRGALMGPPPPLVGPEPLPSLPEPFQRWMEMGQSPPPPTSAGTGSLYGTRYADRGATGPAPPLTQAGPQIFQGGPAVEADQRRMMATPFIDRPNNSFGNNLLAQRRPDQTFMEFASPFLEMNPRWTPADRLHALSSAYNAQTGRHGLPIEEIRARSPMEAENLRQSPQAVRNAATITAITAGRDPVAAVRSADTALAPPVALPEVGAARREFEALPPTQQTEAARNRVYNQIMQSIPESQLSNPSTLATVVQQMMNEFGESRFREWTQGRAFTPGQVNPQLARLYQAINRYDPRVGGGRGLRNFITGQFGPVPLPNDVLDVLRRAQPPNPLNAR